MSGRLIDLVDKFNGTPILVLGDIILDHYVFGGVSRISPEAPVVVVNSEKEDFRPGGAGNVAANLAALGAEVHLLGALGRDGAGDRLLSELEETGVDVSFVYRVAERPTTQKTRVIANAQQIVRVDREEVGPFDAGYEAALLKSVEKLIPNVGAVIVSDYGKGALCYKSLFDSFTSYKEGHLVGMDSVPVIVDPKPPHFDLYHGVSIIKPNKKEAELASGKLIRNRSEGLDVAEELKKRWGCDAVLITLGADGMVLSGEGRDGPARVEIETEARDVFDVSGAGDTVSAVFGLSLAVGSSLEDACRLANLSAGVVVGEVGTVTLKPEKLVSAINGHN